MNVWPFLVLLSFLEKNDKLLLYETVETSVSPSSVEILSLRNNLASNRPIALKLGLNVAYAWGARLKGVTFLNCKLQIYATYDFLQINLCAWF